MTLTTLIGSWLVTRCYWIVERKADRHPLGLDYRNGRILPALVLWVPVLIWFPHRYQPMQGDYLMARHCRLWSYPACLVWGTIMDRHAIGLLCGRVDAWYDRRVVGREQQQWLDTYVEARAQLAP